MWWHFFEKLHWNLCIVAAGSCLGSAECLALYSRGADAVVPTSCILSEDEESARIDISPRLVRKGFLKKKWPGPSQFREVLAALEVRDHGLMWLSLGPSYKIML